MKKIFTVLALSFAINASAQVQFSQLGLGFNFSNTQRVPNNMLSSNFEGETISDGQFGNYGTINRVFSSYEFGLKPSNLKFMFFDFDLLQGTEFIYASDYSNRQNGDTSFRSSYNLDLSSSLIGLKGMVRVSTPSDKRFIYNFGIGGEGYLAYNVEAEGNKYETIEHWPTNFFVNNNESLNEQKDNYSSYNLVQQAGLAWRLGKDEKSFPLNKTYLEGDFQIINNFTLMNGGWNKYRTYGFTLSLVYEVN